MPITAVERSAGFRTSSGSAEIDRVLGGGIMRGSSVLVGGEPGIGKSTLMLQIAARAESTGRIVYISGEESAEQIRERAERLDAVDDRIEILCETNLANVIFSLDAIKPIIFIVDSLQTIVSDEVSPVPGTVNQIKYASYELMSWARQHSATAFMVAHVTKEGTIAGPKIVEHMVDTVLYFDESDSELRILRATKNRFGSVDEIGLFTMGENGLEEVSRPDLLFLHHRTDKIPPGIVVAPIYEGSRVLVVELQALVVPAKGSFSRVYSDRIDSSRVSRVAAVLEKHVGVRFSDQDIYVNVAGGMKINEVGVELPLALALYSARTSLPVEMGTAAAGELTLAGEIRQTRHMRNRVKAAKEISLKRVIGPSDATAKEEKGWTIVETINEAIAAVF